MKEISKKDLVSLVTENQFDIDEMGYTPRFQTTKTKSGRLERGQGKKKIDPVTGKEIEPQASRVKPLIHPTMSVAGVLMNLGGVSELRNLNTLKNAIFP